MRRSGSAAAGLLLAAMLFAAGCGPAAPGAPAALPQSPASLPAGFPEPVERALARTEARRGEAELVAVSVTPSGEGLVVLLCVRTGEGVRADRYVWRDGRLLEG